MKALPARYQEQEYTSALDDTVKFTIQPLTNQLRAHIQGLNSEANKDGDVIINPGGWAYDAIGFSLVSLEGLEDFQPEWALDIKIGNQTYKRLEDECMDLLPRELFNEIYMRVNLAIVIKPEDVDNMGFTAASCTQESSAEGTSPPVDAETESRSDEPSPPDAPGSS